MTPKNMSYVATLQKVVKLKVHVFQVLNVKKSQHDVTPTRHETHVILSRDKSVDLTGVLPCRATLVERLRHNLLRLRQVSSM